MINEDDGQFGRRRYAYVNIASKPIPGKECCRRGETIEMTIPSGGSIDQ